MYYRPFYANKEDYRFTVITMQSFDEHDYNKARYLTQKKFYEEVDAWLYLLKEKNIPVEQTDFFKRHSVSEDKLYAIRNILYCGDKYGDK